MKAQEANKIIAEYMGNTNPVPVNLDKLSARQLKMYLPYMYSLDALVPVWEKLSTIDLRLCGVGYDCHFYETNIGYKFKLADNFSEGKTIQEAAAIATAKAIQELKP